MPQVLLKGTAGTPRTTREGSTTIVKKDIANVVLEERIPTRKLKGKQAPGAVYTKAEVKAKVEAAKSEAADHVAKHANGLLAAQKKEVEAKAFEAADALLKRQEKKTKATVKTLKNNAQARIQKTKAIQASATEKIAKAERDSAKAGRDTAKAIALNKDLLDTNEQQAEDLNKFERAKTDLNKFIATDPELKAAMTKARVKLQAEQSASSAAPKTPGAKAPGTPAASKAPGTPAASKAPGTPSRVPLTPAQRGRSKSMAR